MLHVVVLLALAALPVLAVGVVGRRRLLQRGGGTVELAVRLRPDAAGGGWVPGVGRFVEDELQWYRVFSLAPRPRRRFCRVDLRVDRRRAPDGPEVRSLQGAVVLCCRTGDGPVELGIEPSAVTGFLAWLEARPPGVTLGPG